MCRKVLFNPKVTYFKPRGVPIRNVKIARISKEEIEALRLKDVLELEQTECARKMNTSQSTFQRILSQARKKVSKAIIEGEAIEIEK
jgi:predicted DNA-binding protein (UPF0251 family)